MFDPTKPANHSPLSSAEMRSQLNGLKDLIDAILTLTAAQVDGVSTVNPSDPAQASVNVSGNTLHFSFAIPRGIDGNQGVQGNEGQPGPPFAQAVVDGVNTLDPGQQAAVGVSFDGANVHFTFSIPRGNDGNPGAQGIPGEVTQTDLNNGLQNTLNQTSNNSNAVSNFGQSADGNYNPTQIQELMNKMDELIHALRR
jgi:hypothetical protein